MALYLSFSLPLSLSRSRSRALSLSLSLSISPSINLSLFVYLAGRLAVPGLLSAEIPGRTNLIQTSVYDNTRAQCKLLQTCIILDIVREHLVQIGRKDGSTGYLS